MIIARFLHQGRQSYGIVEGEQVRPVEGDIFGDYRLTSAINLTEVRLLSPVAPSKILAVGLNYRSHLDHLKDQFEPPAQPELFLKPSSAVIGPDEPIILPDSDTAGRIDYEGELVAVIGRRCRRVSESQALDFVLGYTCGNDVSARRWQKKDLQWWRAKGADTFAPLGPWIVDGLDPTNLELRTRVNGEVRQSANTSLLIYSVAEVISFASRVMTLEPGDVLFTGTPGEPGSLSPGDVVEIEVERVGVLRNTVKGSEGQAGRAKITAL